MRNLCEVSILTLEFAKQTESEMRNKTEHKLAVARLNWQNQSKKHILKGMRMYRYIQEVQEKHRIREKPIINTLFSFEGAKCIAIAGHLDCATAQYH